MNSTRNQPSAASTVTGIALPPYGEPIARSENIVKIRDRIGAKNRELLKHRYFQQCRSKEITRGQVVEVLKQVYCFSFFFERLLTRRIAESSHDADSRIMKLARRHLRDELGHVQLFAECLKVNGVAQKDLAGLRPKTFTKAVFGYLLATIQHENEYVANVAIMQVMESIGVHFFSATLDAMRQHGMAADAIAQHSEDDAEHETIGLDLLAYVDDQTMRDCDRIIDDMYRLMALMFEEWMAQPTNGRRSIAPPPASGKRSVAPPRKRRTSRPPRSN